MNLLVAFCADVSVVFYVVRIVQLIASKQGQMRKRAWLSVPMECTSAAFLCHPWALVSEDGSLHINESINIADEAEEYYGVCKGTKVSILDDISADEQECDENECIVDASPIVLAGFEVTWGGTPPTANEHTRSQLLAAMKAATVSHLNSQ
jgi:hypothetical protein